MKESMLLLSFLYFLLLFTLIYCQLGPEYNISSIEEINNKFKLEFNKCIEKYGMNERIIKKEKENKNSDIKNILNSYREKLERSKNEHQIKECLRQIQLKMSKKGKSS